MKKEHKDHKEITLIFSEKILETLQKMAEKDAKVLGERNHNNSTPAMIAAWLGHNKVLSLIIDNNPSALE